MLVVGIFLKMKFIYTIFFLGLNYIIWAFLVKKYRFNNTLLYIFITIFLLFICLHLFFNLPSLKSFQDLKDLLFFSLSLIILHFGTESMVAILEKSYSELDDSNKNLQDFVLSIFNFMRFSLIYILISIYQFLDIWDFI